MIAKHSANSMNVLFWRVTQEAEGAGLLNL